MSKPKLRGSPYSRVVLKDDFCLDDLENLFDEIRQLAMSLEREMAVALRGNPYSARMSRELSIIMTDKMRVWRKASTLLIGK